MIIDDSQRVRIIRAILGWNSSVFSAFMEISPGTLTSWEKGRAEPSSRKRELLAALCQKEGIGFSPSGMPFPVEDCVVFATKEIAECQKSL